MNAGDNIKKLREIHDLTQEQLADKLGVTRESVVKWESGKINIRDRHVSKLVEIYGIDPMTSSQKITDSQRRVLRKRRTSR